MKSEELGEYSGEASIEKYIIEESGE